MFNTFLFFLSVSLLFPAHCQEKIIYDDDNREEISEARDLEAIKFQSGVALRVDKKNLLFLPSGEMALAQKPLEDIYQENNRPLCSSVRFKEQPKAGSCSGFLVADNLLVTAGHCMAVPEDCDDRVWVFGATLEKMTLNRYRPEEIFHCKEIISQRYLNGPLDFAIVMLDHKVSESKNSLPYSKASQSELILNDPLFMIGHPMGLPMKIVDDAKVLSLEAGGATTSLDAFSGNSGSPVFSQATHSVVGILVQGEADLQLEASRSCFEEVHCHGTNCSGEFMTSLEVLKIELIKNLLSERKPLFSFLHYCQENNETTEVLKHLFNVSNCDLLFKKLKESKRLVLNQAGLKDLSPLAELTQLESLSLKGNEIIDLSPLKSLGQLTKLNLEGNPIGKNDIHCPNGPQVPFELSFFCAKYVVLP